MRLGHISDLQWGRLRDGRIAVALAEDINGQGCDAVVVTGDLTQRARVWQFREAAAFLNSIEAPLLVVPGNHDVHAWWHRPDLRLRDPLRRYRRMITSDLMPHLELEGLSVLGLNSAHGRTVKGGLCAPGVAERVRAYCEAQPPDAVRVLAIHHPLTAMQNVDAAVGGSEVWAAAVECGVGVICCGHAHISRVTRLGIGNGRRLLVSLAGTAVSNRWRAPQEGVNSWHLITGDPSGLDCQVRRYDADAGGFE